MKNYTEKFVCSIHTHVKSLLDADIKAKDLCERILEMGGKGCVITDHGVLSSIEEYRRVFSSYNLKLIPGVEVYVDGGILGRLHLILIAMNDRGYKGLCKIVTESNKNLDGSFPIVTKQSLELIMSSYQGDIMATSACMQGVISAIFLLNDKVDKEIVKLTSRRDKYLSPESKDVILAQNLVEEAEASVKTLTIKRDDTKRLAEQKFTQREKTVAKLEKAEDKNAKEAREKLNADMILAQKAKEELDDIKKELDSAKKELSKRNAELKKIGESVEKYNNITAQIEEMRKEYKTEEEIHNLAIAEATYYQNLFGKSRFLAEVQYHRIPEEAICYPKVVEIAKELNIPLIASNDVHMLNGTKEERLKRQTLRCLRFGEYREEEKGDEELYLKDNNELANILLEILPEEDVEKAISNIEVVFNACNVAFEHGTHYPKFSDDSEKVFDEAIVKGIAWRFPEGMDDSHKERLEYEISIIKSMGYVDYHLVVKDFLEYGRLLGYVPKNKMSEAPLTIEKLEKYIEENGWKNQGLRIGPGRGSAVGSLACYLLGITNLDPLKYGLLFERFLNPERVSMPDIDSDISAASRPKVIEYVQNKYGYDAVCGIMTTNAQAPKGCLRTAARFYGLKKDGVEMTSVGDKLAKAVPSDVGTSFATIVDNAGKVSDKGVTVADYLKATFPDEDSVAIIEWAQAIEGIFTSYGAHAAGIVISDNKDISEYLPLKMNTVLGMMTTQCDKEQVEENGLLKFDFLGLQTLDIITESIQMIEKNHGVIIDPLSIDLNDSKVYEKIFTIGRTNSVFQFESSGMKNMLRRFKPSCFEDLIILVSMFRPGPLQYLDDVIEVKNGRKPMTFLCPQLEPIVGKTYGAIVYQEQVMEICQKLAGFTLGHSDNVRRFMSKKKEDKLAHEREAFVEGCAENGISSEIANQLFDQMMDFAKYAFNKSHAAAYAYNAFVTAWLKCYYPAEFFAGALNWAAKTEDIAGLMYEASVSGVKVLQPDVNVSDKEFSVSNGEIRFGLSSVKGVKDHADEIINERQSGTFISLADFIARVMPNKTVYNNLIAAGALDAYCDNRTAMKTACDKIQTIAANRNKKASFIKSAECVLPIIEKATVEELVKAQQEAGLKSEIVETTTVEKLEKRIETAKKTLSNLEAELRTVKIINCPEDKAERMQLEKDFLGMYVTAHPMDLYPETAEVGSEIVSDLTTNSSSCYGVITNLSIKYTKKDGKAMAFFNIEDKSGNIEVCMFARAYADFKDIVKEGNVVRLTGEIQIDDRDDSEKLKFIVNGGKIVDKRSPKFILPVVSVVNFMNNLNSFKENFMDENGLECHVVDMTTNMIQSAPLPFKVSERIRFFCDVQETFKI